MSEIMSVTGRNVPALPPADFRDRTFAQAGWTIFGLMRLFRAAFDRDGPGSVFWVLMIALQWLPRPGAARRWSWFAQGMLLGWMLCAIALATYVTDTRLRWTGVAMFAAMLACTALIPRSSSA
jgi:hypothetical protein